MTEQELRSRAEKLAGQIFTNRQSYQHSFAIDVLARELAEFRRDVLREALWRIRAQVLEDIPCVNGCDDELERLAAEGE